MVCVSLRILFFCARFCAVARAWKGLFPVVVFPSWQGEKRLPRPLPARGAHETMPNPAIFHPKLCGFLWVAATTWGFSAGRTYRNFPYPAARIDKEKGPCTMSTPGEGCPCVSLLAGARAYRRWKKPTSPIANSVPRLCKRPRPRQAPDHLPGGALQGEGVISGIEAVLAFIWSLFLRLVFTNQETAAHIKR